jgi:hypothetical protein
VRGWLVTSWLPQFGDCGLQLAKPPSAVQEATPNGAYLMLFLHRVKVEKSFEFLNLTFAAPRIQGVLGSIV